MAANIFEQAPELTEIGAAVAHVGQLDPRVRPPRPARPARRRLHDPTELIYRDWRTGDRIAAHPVAQGRWYVQRFGAPYFGIHRADLQRILSGAFGGGEPASGLSVGEHRRAGRLGRAGVRQRADRARRSRGRRGRRALHRATVGHRRRRRRSTPAPAPSAASCRSRTCPSFPTRRRSSSGWARTRTSCTTPSGAAATRSTSSPSSRTRRSGCTRARWSRSARRCRSPPSAAGTRRSPR